MVDEGEKLFCWGWGSAGSQSSSVQMEYLQRSLK